MGLALYPGLMSADIIACRATHVAAGCDQSRHLEYAKLISGRINALAHSTLSAHRGLVPKAESCFSQPVKLMSLQAPAAKMSKSDLCSLGCVYVLDSYSVVSAKIALAKTDASSRLPSAASGLSNRPGLANLIEMYVLTAGVCLQTLLALAGGVSVRRFKL